MNTELVSRWLTSKNRDGVILYWPDSFLNIILIKIYTNLFPMTMDGGISWVYFFISNKIKFPLSLI